MLIGVAACSPNLARRYKNVFKPDYRWVLYTKAQRYCTVDVSSFTVTGAPTPAPDTKPRKDVTSLAPSAQVALIAALSKGAGVKPKELIASLGEQFADPAFLGAAQAAAAGKPEAELSPINQTRIISKRILKQINLSSRKNIGLVNDQEDAATFNGIADHLVMLEVEMTLPADAPMTFASWDSFETVYGTIDLGKVTSSQELALSATISAKAGGSASLNSAATDERAATNTRSTKAGTTAATSATAGSGGKDGTDEFNQHSISQENTTKADAANSSEGVRVSSGKQTGETKNGFSNSYEVGPSGTVAYKGVYNTEDSPTERILLFSGTLQPRRMVVKQTGAKGRYIEGNNKALVECEVQADWAAPIVVSKLPARLYDTKNNPIAPTKLRLPRILILFPDVKADVSVAYKYNFLHRSVLGGSSRHLTEARQRVKFWHGRVGYQTTDSPTDNQSAILVQKSDFRPKTYQIVLPDAGAGLDVSFNGSKLNFDTAKEALDFIEYSFRLADAMASGTTDAAFATGATVLNKDNLHALKVKTIQN